MLSKFSAMNCPDEYWVIITIVAKVYIKTEI